MQFFIWKKPSDQGSPVLRLDRNTCEEMQDAVMQYAKTNHVKPSEYEVRDLGGKKICFALKKHVRVK